MITIRHEHGAMFLTNTNEYYTMVLESEDYVESQEAEKKTADKKKKR